MPEFEIVFKEVRENTINIEAENEEEAEKKFFEKYDQGIDDDDLTYDGIHEVEEIVEINNLDDED